MDKNKQTLPNKENSLFKRILRCYEQKQYEAGLKIANLILSNHPEHGETLAMKGLTLNCLGRREEAYNYVKQGLRNNLTSHVCWHVYGLLQRSEKKYDEAIKCYINALKWDKDNLQILRDLSLLQIQIRDLKGYKDTRFRLFDLRPTQRASWIGYAMSFHLLEQYEMALQILEDFRKTMHKTTYDYEYSEFLLYQNMVIRESGRKEEALRHLNKFQSSMCDKVTLQELKGELLMDLGRSDEASEVYRFLVNRNPENRSYYLNLEKTLNLSTEEEKLSLYEEMKQKFPRAHVPRRLPLNYATGERLVELLDPYLRAALQKGVPPLFTDVRGLYSDPDKARMIERLMLNYVDNLRQKGYLSEADKRLEPSSILYGLMYLAQHYSYLGNTNEALRLLQEALDHTPTLIELYILKGEILKHAGDTVNACEALVEAQSLDTADRYVNSKAASYLLAAGRIPEADKMCSKFTREGVSAMENLNEMQCMWFQTECAEAYFRAKDYGLALKKCHEVDRHFTEIMDDQFDFHTYCMRKMTLRSYVQLLRLEDSLRHDSFYWTAASIAIRIYLSLYDNPDLVSTEEPEPEPTPVVAEETTNDTRESKQSKNNKKSSANHKRKPEKNNKPDNDKKNAKTKNKKNEEADMGPTREALVPAKLVGSADPLAEAERFLQPLRMLAANRLMTHIFAFEVYRRKNKPLIMLQSVKRALNLDPSFPELHPCVVRFLAYRRDYLSDSKSIAENDDLPEDADEKTVIKTLIDRELTKHFVSLDPVQVNEDFLNKYKDSAPHRLQAARGMLLLDSVQRERALEIATSLDEHLEAISVEHCAKTLEWLESNEVSASELELVRYKAASETLFPLATVFKPPSALTNAISEEETKLAEEEEEPRLEDEETTKKTMPTKVLNHIAVDQY